VGFSLFHAWNEDGSGAANPNAMVQGTGSALIVVGFGDFKEKNSKVYKEVQSR